MEETILDTFSYHYPPELLTVLCNAIPKLFRSKDDLLSFFRGAGVKPETLKPYEDMIAKDRNSIKMKDITRGVLVKLNEQEDKALSARRMIVQRVVEFENFDLCYENQRDAARGLVSQVREIVNRKDAFTQMNIERKQERLRKIREKEAALVAEQKKKKESIEKISFDLSSLISYKDPHKRGKALEKVLNCLFAYYEISVSDAFTISGEHSEGVIEQIDGVIELEGSIYIVEMKWWKNAIGRSEMVDHIVRIANRGGYVIGLFISYSDFSPAAILECNNALNRGVVVVLARLDEIYKLLEKEYDLKIWLKEKTTAALTHKKPFFTVDM